MYEKGPLIHSGPFADVFEGTDEKGRVYALKVADLDFQRKPHDFRQEIQIVKALRHPNIVEYIDNYVLGEDHYLVMPLYALDLTGVMAHHMKRKTKFDLANPQNNKVIEQNYLPVDSAKAIVHGLIEALKYVHAHKLIHRDIKPANVFFPTIESLERPVLGDFGVSYNMDRPKEPYSNKVTDVSTGYYKAPELCFGVTDYGYEVDLWSLGIVISYLYSNSGTPVNTVDLQGDDREITDLVLIQGTFEAFGTPTPHDNTSDLFWPRLAAEDSTFLKLNFKKYNRKPTQSLLPRCNDTEVQEIFLGLTRYTGRKL